MTVLFPGGHFGEPAALPSVVGSCAEVVPELSLSHWVSSALEKIIPSLSFSSLLSLA